MGLGIFLGILAFLVVGATTSECIVHTTSSGLFPGLIAGLWVFWPFMQNYRRVRYNFLHPVPRKYSQPLKHAYSKVRQILGETTYKYGDKWHVTTSDTIERRIGATLRFTDEESKLEGNSVQNFHVKTERKQRLIELSVQFSEDGTGKTIIRLDFAPRVEGANFAACDTIITRLTTEIENAMGVGVVAADPAETKLSAPPWWLLISTCFMLLFLWSDINKAVFGQ